MKLLAETGVKFWLRSSSSKNIDSGSLLFFIELSLMYFSYEVFPVFGKEFPTATA